MFLLLYNFFIILVWPLYRALILYHPEAIRFHKERLKSLENLYRFYLDVKKQGPVWIHASSQGEVDQALGLIRAVKKHHPNQKICLSVFSNSIKKLNLPEADFMFRLPLDYFFIWPGIISIMKPRLFVTMTWDIFPNLLYHLKRKNIPSFLSSAALKQNSWRLKFPFRPLLNPVYEMLSGIGCADEKNAGLFLNLLPDENRVKNTGDSRYDTILYKIKNAKLPPDVRKKIASIKGKILILASTYEADDKELYPGIAWILEKYSDWKVLVFPHHVNENRIQAAKKAAEDCHIAAAVYSQKRNLAGERFIIVDQLGILALAYEIGDIAYVGGAFHNRIHNTAEAAAFALPVVTGSRISTSPPANALSEAGALFAFEKGSELINKLDELIKHPAQSREAGLAGKKLVKAQSGASERFYKTFLSRLIG